MNINSLFKKDNKKVEGSILDLFIDKEDQYIRVERHKNSQDVLLVFSHTNYPKGKFAMTNILKNIGVTTIYVNCQKNSWYQQGLEGVSSNIDETVEVLHKIINELRPEKVYCTGMSMGGYAALLFGLLLNVDAILAFTAEILIGEEYARSYYSNDSKKYDYRYKSLGNLIRENKKTQIYGVYGIYDFIDLSLLWTISDQIVGNKKVHIFYTSGNHQVTYRLDIHSIVNSLLKKGKLINEDIHPVYTLIQNNDPIIFMLFREVKILMDNSNYNEIYDLLSENSYTKTSPQLLYYLGIACLETKKIENAISSLRMAVELDPYFHSSLFQLASAYQSLEKLDEAIHYYKMGIEQKPDYPNGYYRLGMAYLSIQDKQNAIVCFIKALELHPKYPEVNYQYALIKLANNEYEESAQLLKTALKVDPNNPDYNLYMGISLLKQEKFIEAASFFKKTK